MADIFARMRQIIGTTAEWTADNIILELGEIGVETGSGSPRMKIGDGTTPFLSLPYTAAEGDITAVTAGAGLAGGGTTGAVSLSMPNVGTPGTYGSASDVPVLTTDAQGRVSGVVNTPIVLPNVGTAGTYGDASNVPRFTTDAKGRVTGVVATPINYPPTGVTSLSAASGVTLTPNPITGTGTVGADFGVVASKSDLAAYLPLAGGTVSGAFIVAPGGSANVPTMPVTDTSTAVATTAWVRDFSAMRGYGGAEWKWITAPGDVEPGTGNISIDNLGGSSRRISLSKIDANGNTRYLLLPVPGDTIIITDSPDTPPITGYARYDVTADPIDHPTWVSYICNRVDTAGSTNPPADGTAVRVSGYLNTSNGDGPVLGVSAGYGLSGGGSTGVVELAINTAIVAQLGSNTFTGSQYAPYFEARQAAWPRMDLFATDNPVDHKRMLFQMQLDGSSVWQTNNDANDAAMSGVRQYGDPISSFFAPIYSGTMDLGSSSLRWRNLYITGDLAANTGTFSASVAAPTLYLTNPTGAPVFQWEAPTNPVDKRKARAILDASGALVIDLVNDAVTTQHGGVYLSADGLSFSPVQGWMTLGSSGALWNGLWTSSAIQLITPDAADGQIVRAVAPLAAYSYFRWEEKGATNPIRWDMGRNTGGDFYLSRWDDAGASSNGLVMSRLTGATEFFGTVTAPTVRAIGSASAANYAVLDEAAINAGSFGFTNSNGPRMTMWGNSAAGTGSIEFTANDISVFSIYSNGVYARTALKATLFQVDVAQYPKYVLNATANGVDAKLAEIIKDPTGDVYLQHLNDAANAALSQFKFGINGNFEAATMTTSTPAPGTNNTQVPTTAFVQAAISSGTGVKAAFRAMGDGVTASGGAIKMPTGPAVFNVGGAWDDGAKRFTPPAGVYTLQAACRLLTSNLETSVSIYKNGVVMAKAASGDEGAWAHTPTVSITDQANGTDYYEAFIVGNAAAGVPSSAEMWFSAMGG